MCRFGIEFGFPEHQKADPGDHDQGVKDPANCPGKGNEVLIVGNGSNQTRCDQGVESIHSTCRKKRQTDNWRGDIAGSRKMNEREQNGGKCHGKCTPFQQSVGKGPTKTPEHCIQQFTWRQSCRFG